MIKNIIFDFGNVLLDIDEALSYQKLSLLLDSKKSADLYTHVILPYESGLISEDAFLNRLQRRSSVVWPAINYIEAWNAMILDFPEERIELVIQLKNQFRVFLLSNTNITHLRCVRQRILKKTKIQNFEAKLFEKAYYSHELKLRKPDPQIFKFVLTDSKLIANETLFIDDKSENIWAAEKLGIRTLHLKPEMDITNVLPFYLTD